MTLLVEELVSKEINEKKIEFYMVAVAKKERCKIYIETAK